MSLERVRQIIEEFKGKPRKPVEFGTFEFSKRVMELQRTLTKFRRDIAEIEEALKQAQNAEIDVTIEIDSSL